METDDNDPHRARVEALEKTREAFKSASPERKDELRAELNASLGTDSMGSVHRMGMKLETEAFLEGRCSAEQFIAKQSRIGAGLGMKPTIPADLNPLAKELLERLEGDARASELVIGGGVALSHYVEHRKTNDLDTWWRKGRDDQTLKAVEQAMQEMAKHHDMTLKARTHGEVTCFDLHEKEGNKVFSFEVAARDTFIGQNLRSAWDPVLIESFADNLGSKMTALVNRGAPRDFLDLHAICARAGVEPGKCWEVYAVKHGLAAPQVRSAQAKVTDHLERIEKRRPLDSIKDLEEKREAAKIRTFFRKEFNGPDNGKGFKMGR